MAAIPPPEPPPHGAGRATNTPPGQDGRATPCADVAHLLSGYAANELSDPERTAVKRHLCSCRQCEGEVAEYREVLALAHTLPALAPPPAAETRILRALTDAVRSRLPGGSLDETTVERPLS